MVWYGYSIVRYEWTVGSRSAGPAVLTTHTTSRKKDGPSVNGCQSKNAGVKSGGEGEEGGGWSSQSSSRSPYVTSTYHYM